MEYSVSADPFGMDESMTQYIIEKLEDGQWIEIDSSVDGGTTAFAGEFVSRVQRLQQEHGIDNIRVVLKP
jgi:hypothetical protein